LSRCLGFDHRLVRNLNSGQRFDQRSQPIAMNLQIDPRDRRLPLEQILDLMAGVGDLPQPHHPTRALEGVQLAQEQGRRVLVIVIF
jgi:hypothetical protein